MKSSYLIRAYKFAKQVLPYLENCSTPLGYEWAIRDYNRAHKRKVICASGMTRIALITSDYVIKFDYNEGGAQRFGGCENEVEFYKYAKDNGYGDLFAAITRIMVGGRFCYVMPRINGIGRYEDRYVQEFLDCDDADFVDEHLQDLHDQNYGWKNGYPVIIDYACNDLASLW